MECEICKKGKIVEGTLEGVSFRPSKQRKKIFASGIYGIKAKACSNCGRLIELELDTKALNKIMEKN